MITRMKSDTMDALHAAQKAVAITSAAAEHARDMRRDAVQAALDEDCSKYSIAGALGVQSTTVDSIIATIARRKKTDA